MSRSLILPIAALALCTQPAAAQSLFGTRGLGTPLAPVDARARALGGIGVGLLGLNTSLVNPAEVAGLGRRTIAAAMQPSSRSVEFDGRTDDLGGTRFPLMRVLHPIGSDLMFSLGYGGFLDQSWAVVSEGHEILGGDSVRTRDLIDSDGGIAQVQFGTAYSIAPSLAVGAAVGVYTGRLERRITRTFPDSAALETFETGIAWTYRAPLAAVGIRWDPAPVLRIGASAIWSGRLDAAGAEGEAEDRSFDLPLQVAGGASAWLSPQLLAAVSGRWAGWSSAASGFEDPDAAADTWQMGAGLEWTGARAGSGDFPIRLGFNYGRLPFRIRDAVPSEWSLALGLGARMAMTDAGPRALADLALERGGRGDPATTGLTESFWRLTFSLALLGQ